MGNLIKIPACFKKAPTFIDCIISNHKQYLTKSANCTTALSDFLLLTTLKSSFIKQNRNATY